MDSEEALTAIPLLRREDLNREIENDEIENGRIEESVIFTMTSIQTVLFI